MKNRSTFGKGRNGHQVAVSPFDGANRIRFKGSRGLPISDFGLPIGRWAYKLYFINESIRNQKS
jgi:hypothetical protein